MLYINESPYWLIQNGKRDEARVSLQWYRGKKYDIDKEYEEIVAKKEEELAKEKPSVKQKIDTVFSMTFLKCWAISGANFFLCQFTGISSLVVYMTNVFKESGTTLDPFLAPVII